MAVASPSTLGLVARMISLTPSLTRESSPLIFRSSGPMPCSGERAPISTWYLPLNSRVLSMAATFCGSSTTQITRRSRASLQQNAHGSSSVMLLQIEQYVTRSFTSRSRARGPGRDTSEFHPGWQHSAHLLRHLFIGLPLRVVHGGDDEILQHFHIVFRDDFGVDLQRLNLFGAVHDHSDHTTTGIALDLELRHLLLQALLHLLRLLHHLLNVHI